VGVHYRLITRKIIIKLILTQPQIPRKIYKEKQSHLPMKKKSGSKKILNDLKQNYWISTTIILAILLTVSVISGISHEDETISPDDAGAAILQFALEQGAEAELINVTDTGSLYEVIISISGEEATIYATRDGKNLVPYVYPLTAGSTNQTTTETTTPKTTTPKTLNPISQLFIWSYCPYGVTALTPFAEVAQLLGGNLEVVLYYAGHGDFEIQQNKIQACIQDLGYTAQYWNYAKQFAADIYEACYGDLECDLKQSTELMDSLEIDSAAVLSCVDEKGEALLEEDYTKAQQAGVTGSPSLVVNGVKSSAGRTANAYKEAICSGYETAPAECDTALDSTTETTSGNC
jgi:hypothetical protein